MASFSGLRNFAKLPILYVQKFVASALTLSVAFYLILTLPAYAQPLDNQGVVDEYVVSATRIATPSANVASSITVISQDEIEKRRELSVAEVLREVPGLDLVKSGGAGGNTALFMRGANSEHTLVLIDGVEANNPVLPNRSFNFSDLTLINIERIEILRGPQSTLYGSDALGGVINIITKRGARGAPRLSVSAEAGSYNTYTEQAALSGAESNLEYSLSANRQDSHSISAADARDGNQEKDPYENTAIAGRLAVGSLEELQAVFSVRALESQADLDNAGGVGGDDPNRVLDSSQLFARAELRSAALSSELEQSLAVSLSDQEFDDDNDPDPAHPLDLQRSNYRGRLLKLEQLNFWQVLPELRLSLGLETEEEKANSSLQLDGAFGPFSSVFDERSIRTDGVFFQTEWQPLQPLSLAAGVRVDHHERFGEEVTWRFAPLWRIEETGTRLLSNIGTGFKAPSLFQLYSSFGNPELSPERSLGLDAGFEQDLWSRRVTIGASYFWNDFDNLITFDPETFIAENTAQARTQGLEASLKLQLSSAWTGHLDYTYLDTEDRTTGQRLLRRARHKLGAQLGYALSEALDINLHARYIGERLDNDFSTFPSQTVSLSSYLLCGLSAGYRVSERLEVFARAENIFDKEYQEVLGFGTTGRAGYGGIKVSL
jgi:vitamin B12 transporter